MESMQDQKIGLHLYKLGILFFVDTMGENRDHVITSYN